MSTNTEGTAEPSILMEDDAHTAWKRLKEQNEGVTRTNPMALLSRATKRQFDNRTATIDKQRLPDQMGKACVDRRRSDGYHASCGCQHGSDQM